MKQAKPLPTGDLHPLSECVAQILATLLPTQLPANEPGRQLPESLDGMPSSQLRRDPAPADSGIWGISKWWLTLSTSAPPILCLSNKILLTYFIFLNGNITKRGRERDLSSVGFGLSTADQAEARSFNSHVDARTQALGSSTAAFPGTLAGSWVGSRAAEGCTVLLTIPVSHRSTSLSLGCSTYNPTLCYCSWEGNRG